MHPRLWFEIFFWKKSNKFHSIHHFYQVEKINKANEAKLHAADEKKAKNLADVKDKV